MRMAIRDITDPANLTQIQGNIVGGFNKDCQAFLFLHFTDPDQARAWLRSVVDLVATAQEVLGFNDLFRIIRRRRYGGRRRDADLPITATWLNLALSYTGLQALGVADGELGRFPEEFVAGMAARKDRLGDLEGSDPHHWVGPFGVQLLYRQNGTTRPDQPGHEHFGFKDGVSQPGLKGITQPVDPANHPDQGQFGQDLLFPSEFALGHQRQQEVPPALELADGEAIPELPDGPGPQDINGPDWALDGSYLVFRRLQQDVPGFKAFVAAQAAAAALDPAVFGAKLVGRYESGAPLERTEGQDPRADPAQGDPSGLDRSLIADNINNFEFQTHDADGSLAPHAAHIRKVYPRNQVPPGEGNTQTHRILRRGIAFGPSFAPGSPPASLNGANTPRGLCFACYQRSIVDQFEFIQQQWANSAPFPDGFSVGPPSGQDPIIGQDPHPFFNLVGADPHIALQRWVTMTGGEYFF